MAHRVLYLPIYETGDYHNRALLNKHGLRSAFAAVGEVREIDYLALPRPELFETVLRAIDDFQPTLLFTQLHGGDCITPEQMRTLRERYPAMKVANWTGDVWPHSSTAPLMLDLLHNVDIQLVVNASYLPVYQENGICGHFWPHAVETALRPLPEVPAYDVVYLGTNYDDHRTALGKILRSLPYRVGIYGLGWPEPNGECLYDFGYGEALYRNATLTISDNQFPDAVGYLSNRPFQAMYAGCFVLQQAVPSLQEYTGLIPEIHYGQFEALEDLPDVINGWLMSKEMQRLDIARDAQNFVCHHHTFAVRVRDLMGWLYEN